MMTSGEHEIAKQLNDIRTALRDVRLVLFALLLEKTGTATSVEWLARAEAMMLTGQFRVPVARVPPTSPVPLPTAGRRKKR